MALWCVCCVLRGFVGQVGVGISGREGLQAVNSSDFAIAQFRFLLPLLLIHGRWSYRRMAKVFLYSFFKNVVITFTLFYFNIFTGWSGTSLYDSLVYSGFNFFLGLPIIGVGIFDRSVHARAYHLTRVVHTPLCVWGGGDGVVVRIRCVVRVSVII